MKHLKSIVTILVWLAAWLILSPLVFQFFRLLLPPSAWFLGPAVMIGMLLIGARSARTRGDRIVEVALLVFVALEVIGVIATMILRAGTTL